MESNILRALEATASDPSSVSKFFGNRVGSFDSRYQTLQLFIHSLYPMTQKAYELIHSQVDNLVYVYFFDQMDAQNWDYLSQKIAETQKLLTTLASTKL